MLYFFVNQGLHSCIGDQDLVTVKALRWTQGLQEAQLIDYVYICITLYIHNMVKQRYLYVHTDFDRYKRWNDKRYVSAYDVGVLFYDPLTELSAVGQGVP